MSDVASCWPPVQRLTECGLELHPEKARIVYCKDANRGGQYPRQQFDFLGYTFRPHLARSGRGESFVGFLPAISNKAAKSIRQAIRAWGLHRRGDFSLEDLVRWVNPVLTGWINYYGHFFKSALEPLRRPLDFILVKWAARRYKRFKGSRRRARLWLKRLRRREPSLFGHWYTPATAAGQ